MTTLDDRLVITFNGEIYNHTEIRKQLEQRGHRFRTDHCDTEVLLYGYREWGPALLDKLNGMWSFVIHDARSGKLGGFDHARDGVACCLGVGDGDGVSRIGGGGGQRSSPWVALLPSRPSPVRPSRRGISHHTAAGSDITRPARKGCVKYLGTGPLNVHR